MRNLQVSFKNINSELPVSISLSGNLTTASAMDFKRDLLKVVAETSTDCHIDITTLNQMDATGVNALAMAHKATQTKGTKLVIVSSEDNPAEEFLYLSKFDKYFNFQRA